MRPPPVSSICSSGSGTPAFWRAGRPRLRGPAFPDVERRAEQAAGPWRFYVTCVQRYPWTFLTAGGEATAVRIPPAALLLGLIGTHDAHRGACHGMRLLAKNLTTIDAAPAPPVTGRAPAVTSEGRG